METRRAALMAMVAFGGLTVGILSACSSDEPQAAPASVQDFTARLTAATVRENRLFHTVADSARRLPGGTPERMYSEEFWLDAANDRARIEFRKDPAYDADIPESQLSIAADGQLYTDEGDLRRRVTDFADWRDCRSLQGPWVIRRLVCPFPLSSLEDASFAVVPNTEFEGTHTFAIESRRSIEPQSRGDTPPPPGPTAAGQPDPTKPTQIVYRFHVDRSTFLPVAGVFSYEQDGQDFGESVTRFSNDFVLKAGVASDFLDPSAVGYVPQAVLDLQTLDDPKVGVPIYWLGRSFDFGRGLGVVTLETVEKRAPGVAGAGPGTRLGLRYAAPGGDVITLEYWQPGGFDAFVGQLGNGFAWAACSAQDTFEVTGATVLVRLGHEPPRRQIPPTGNEPPPTPVRDCPNAPFDRFMAEVRYADVVVTINAPLSIVDQDGTRFGQFDSEAALRAIAAGLRLRHPGE